MPEVVVHWTVEDFKGLGSATLDLQNGRLSVLTGVNSSGKSSALQSLLLMAQSVYGGGRVVLNGPLVRLGESNDLVREGSESKTVAFSFGVPRDVSEDEDDEAYDVRLSMGPLDDRSGLRPTRLEIQNTDTPLFPLVLDRQNSRGSDLAAAREAIGEHVDFLHLKAALSSEMRTLRTYVSFRGFLPSELIQFDSPESIGKRYRRELEAWLVGEVAESYRGASGSMDRTAFAPAIREFVRLLIRSQESGRQRGRSEYEGLFRARNGNPYTFSDAWMALDAAQQARAIEAAIAQRRQSPYVRLSLGGQRFLRQDGLLELGLDARLRPTLDALESMVARLEDVANRVKYLGPLRDEPRVVWNQWNELARGLPVGTRGEFSAVVLSRAATTRVAHHRPDGVRVNELLLTAVNRWLAYLEIGESVEATSQGKLGVGLNLKVGGQDRDLTAVGVGVSQALPLVVALLAVPMSSIFIVEQPELHLHPAVQSRLADFLLIARPDVTAVVETHSEAFVTRLRRRAAEGNPSASRVGIMFVEPSPEGARTRELLLTEFGDLSDWPRGFLNSGEEDTAAIIAANLRRMKDSTSAD